jgi:AcrR family transcriptional regulator
VPATTIRKSQIRDAAVVLFSERGYYGTSMEDIAAQIGMRASSLYNHVRSKQELLAGIMHDTMQELINAFDQAVASGGLTDQLRAAMEAHVHYHGTHSDEAHIGNREIASLQRPQRDEVVALRRRYARSWQALIQAGIDEGVFDSASAQLSAYALLEMGIGVSQWYREDGPLSLDEIAFQYGEMALRQVGATRVAPATADRGRPARSQPRSP